MREGPLRSQRGGHDRSRARSRSRDREDNRRERDRSSDRKRYKYDQNSKKKRIDSSNESRGGGREEKAMRSGQDILPSCMIGKTPSINSNASKSHNSGSIQIETNKEDNSHRIAQRLKQIGFGKNTVAYDRYIKEVPKSQRKGYNEHPRTPDPYEKVSKRLFDGRIKAWRRRLHQWDEEVEIQPQEENPTQAVEHEELNVVSISHDISSVDSAGEMSEIESECEDDVL